MDAYEQTTTTIRLPFNLKKELQQKAQEMGCPLKDLIGLILRDGARIDGFRHERQHNN